LRIAWEHPIIEGAWRKFICQTTPLSAITFVLEEIIEDLNNRAFLAQVLIASVTATFVCHVFLGDQPAFVIPSIGHFSAILYLLVIPAAAPSALAGAAFQNGTLIWRDRIKRVKRVPFFLKPAVGALVNWILGILVFFAIAKIGVFGLGYGDLETMLHGGISTSQASLLLIAKLAATIAVYAWGGAGGIFSPTLFFGAAIGLAVDAAEAISADSSIREAIARMVDRSANLLVVFSGTENTPVGIVTLHDVLRLQNQFSDSP
jgi:CIC family chloride channel protein